MPITLSTNIFFLSLLFFILKKCYNLLVNIVLPLRNIENKLKIYSKFTTGGKLNMDDITPKNLYLDIFTNSETNEPIIYTPQYEYRTPAVFYKAIFTGQIINNEQALWSDATRVNRVINKTPGYEKKFWSKLEIMLHYNPQIISEIRDNWILLLNSATINKKGLINYVNKNFSTSRTETVFLHNLITNDLTELLTWLTIFSFLPDKSYRLYEIHKNRTKSIKPPTFWETRPVYYDCVAINDAFTRLNLSNNTDYTPSDIDYYRLSKLTKYIEDKEYIIDLYSDTTCIFPVEELCIMSGDFRLIDIFAQGKHLEDFRTNMFDLLSIPEENISFYFSTFNIPITLSMIIGGDKMVLPMRHLLQIIFESDRIFSFNIMGYLSRLTDISYSLKPINISYNSTALHRQRRNSKVN